MELNQTAEESTNNTTKIKLCITPEDLKTNDLSGSELLTIAGIYSRHFESFVDLSTFSALENKGFLQGPSFNKSLTTKGTTFIKKITELNQSLKFRVARMIKPTIEVDESFIDEYRKLFKNTKSGAMGSPTGVKTKMKRFMDNNPNISQEVILEATRRYLDSLNSYNYLQQADYFIYKKDRNGDESSRLEVYVEEVLANPGTTPNEDWTTTLI